MDNFEKGEVITFENGESYVVVDSFVLDGNHYIYVISDDGKEKTAIYKYEGNIVSKLDSEKEFTKAFQELVKRNKDEIDKVLKEFNDN